MPSPEHDPVGLILHAPTADALDRARRNWRNFSVVDPDTPVLIVANGVAVRRAIENPDTDSDAHLRLCENSLQSQGLVLTMTPIMALTTIPAAVVFIHQQQMQGWSYIRA